MQHCSQCAFSRRHRVCGRNRRTYNNSCEAGCNNIIIIHDGECNGDEDDDDNNFDHLTPEPSFTAATNGSACDGT